MKKLVVFDMAGTTIQDFNMVEFAFRKAFDNFGISVLPEQVSKVMGLAKPIAIKMILDKIKTTASPIEIHKKFLANIIDYYNDDSNVKEIPKTSDTLVRLHNNGYKIGLDTGFDRQTADLILSKVGWVKNGLVDAVVTSDEVPQGRPYPYMIFKLMEQLDIQSTKHVIKVGDTISDIEEGFNAGCRVTVGVTSGTCSKSDFKNHNGNFYICESIADVPSLLEMIKL